MNLVIDTGNTQTKLAVFNTQGKLVFKKTVKKISVAVIKKLCISHKIQAAIISSVADHNKAVISFLQAHTRLVLFTHKTKIPVINNYLTPKTLGRDRLGNAIAASHLFPHQNCLVIDAGTCIKYDLVTSKNEYVGGAISPGINMRYKALNAFTAHLPLVKPQPHVNLIGNSTSSAIGSGVQRGAVAEVQQLMNEYHKQYKRLKIVITGGDASLFVNQIKSHIFAAPDLTLIGLNQILEMNK